MIIAFVYFSLRLFFLFSSFFFCSIVYYKRFFFYFFFFFFNDPATPEIYPYLHTLTLHDALPIFDRLRLTAPLAVRDLLAALRLALQPQDDLNLANLLVSPLIGWTQDDLQNRAPREKGVGLWSHLRRTLGQTDLLAPLYALLGQADLTTPYRYLEQIPSGPLDCRRKMPRRLGAEAREIGRAHV